MAGFSELSGLVSLFCLSCLKLCGYGKAMLNLTVKYPDGKTTYHNLEAEDNIIGRAENAHLLIETSNISAYHAHIYWKNGYYWCEDGYQGQPSKNGTWINGKRITEAVPLEKGDNLFIGTCDISVTGIEAAMIEDYYPEDMGEKLPIIGATEEIAAFQDRENLTPQEFHEIQLANLERKIRMQRAKILIALVCMLILPIIIIWLLWPGPSIIKVKKIKKLNMALTSRVQIKKLYLQSEVSGKIVNIYKKSGDLLEKGEKLLELQDSENKTIEIFSPLRGQLTYDKDTPWKIGKSIPKNRKLGEIEYKLIYMEIKEEKLPEWYETQVINVISFRELPKYFFIGKILSISSRQSKKGNISEVLIVVDDPENQIKPNMKPEIRYGFLLPASSILKGKGRTDENHVFIIKDSKCKLRKISVEKKMGNKIFVTKGLKENDLLVIKPKGLEKDQKVKFVIQK